MKAQVKHPAGVVTMKFRPGAPPAITGGTDKARAELLNASKRMPYYDPYKGGAMGIDGAEPGSVRVFLQAMQSRHGWKFKVSGPAAPPVPEHQSGITSDADDVAPLSKSQGLVWCRVPAWMAKALRGSLLVKGAGHKYIKRVPTGKFTKTGKPRYRYYYAVQHGGGYIGHDAELVEDAAFKLTHNGREGHFHILGVAGDLLRIKHDETGHKVTIEKKALQAMLRAHHAEAIAAHTEQVKRDLEATEKFGSEKQKARQRERAQKYGAWKPAKEKLRVKDGKVLTRIQCDQHLTTRQYERASPRGKTWWFMRYEDNGNKFLRDGPFAGHYVDEPLDFEAYLKPGRYMYGCGDRDTGVRVRFEVPDPEKVNKPKPPAPKITPLTDAERESPKLFDWSQTAPPNWLGLSANAIGLELREVEGRRGTFTEGRMNMEIGDLGAMGFYDALDSFSLKMICTAQGDRLDEMLQRRDEDLESTGDPELDKYGKRGRLIKKAVDSLSLWWGTLTDDQREIFARRYCDPVKQASQTQESIDAIHHDAELDVPKGMEKMTARGWKFHEYQKKAINFAAKHSGGRAIWAMEMGLGKTISAYGLFHTLKERGEVKQAIVTAPASALKAWRDEGGRVSDARIVVMQGFDVAKRRRTYEAFKRGEIDVLVMTPGQLGKDTDSIKESFDPATTLRIADEVHFYKSPKSARTRAFTEVLGGKRPGPVVGMTGTILPNTPEDFYTAVSAVDPQALGRNKWVFARRYCVVDESGYKPVIAGFSEQGAKNLYKDNSRTLFARRQSDPDVRLNMPPRRDLSPHLDEDKHQAKIASKLGSLLELHKRTQGDLQELKGIGVDFDFEDIWARLPSAKKHQVMEIAGPRTTAYGLREAYVINEMRLAEEKIRKLREGKDKVMRVLAREDVIPKNMLGVILRMRQAAISPAVIPGLADVMPKNYKAPKIEAMGEAVTTHLTNNPDKGAVVFSSFKGGINEMMRELKGRGVPLNQIRIVVGKPDPGDTTIDPEFHSAIKDPGTVEDDLNEGRAKIVVAQIDALKTGANLQKRANFVGHLDTPYSPDALAQSTARVVRQGQKSPTLVYRPTCGDLETAIEGHLMRKITDSSMAVSKLMDAERYIVESIAAKGVESADIQDPATLAKIMGVDVRVISGKSILSAGAGAGEVKE